MQTALVVTLVFVAATSALGGLRNACLAAATRRRGQVLGAMLAFAMAGWCLFLAVWFRPG